MNPRYFRSAAEMRDWLQKHSGTAEELWLGYYKRGSGKPSVTWPESVDHALCFGWIDGVRKSIDETRYMIRFTPRKPSSTWSAVNRQRVDALRRRNLMQPAGLKAFAARRDNRSGIYSYEQRPEALPEPYVSLLKKRAKACKFFLAQPPSYRRAAIWWVVSAKQEATRLRRLERLIEDSGCGRRLEQFTSPKSRGSQTPR